LDGVLNYLPCPTEASNYALVQSKNEEKVPNSKKELNEIIRIAYIINRGKNLGQLTIRQSFMALAKALSL